MPEVGFRVKYDSGGGNRVEMQCPHGDGLLYVVPSEANWVCSQELLYVHAMSGFFNDVHALDNPEVKALMQRWGLYFRETSLQSPGI